MGKISFKNSRFFLVFALLLTGAVPAAAQPTGDPEEDVRITFAPETDTLNPAAPGALLIRFAPRKGFHVNAVPAMSVAFDSLSAANLRDSMTVPQDTATGYLDSRRPVRQPFALKKGLRRGKAGISGILTYYYCSDAEGWCRREKKSFTVPVTVK